MRARPVRFSDSTGLRLCGIADEPFWPSEKNSSASSTSVRCRWRISVASRSIDDGDHAERREVHRVAVARDHLGRDRLEREPHRLGDMRLDARIDLGEGADRAGDRAGRDLLARGDQPLAGAGELGIGIGELQPEGDRLGMDAVGAADGRRHLVLEGAPLQRRQHLVDVGEQQVGGAGQLHVEAGVEHVGRGHALVHEARLGTDDLGEMGQEGDDVVLGLALDLVDALDVEDGVLGLGPDRPGGLLRDHAELGQRVGRVRLDLEPDLEARLRLPDRGHFRAGVAGDHQRSPGKVGRGTKKRLPARCFYAAL